MTASVLAVLLLAAAAAAAHLPAVRRAGPPQRVDSRREVASRLLRTAASHKERSLRDVLIERDAAREARPAPPPPPASPPREEPSIRTMSQLFAWAINTTVYTATVESSGGASAGVDGRAPGSVRIEVGPREVRADATVAGEQRALPGSSRRKSGRPRRARGVASDAADLELLNSATESEFDVLRRHVHTLRGERAPGVTVHALQVVEELCHSIDNGRDLQVSGGLAPLLGALDSRHDAVRASAAWALATCCQNNPPVQNASLALGAVPRLARLAVRDGSAAVRSKALFALNALLELESARVAFEELPFAVHVVRKALLDPSDHRATRRALNLTELLVQKNLDAWKTQLEAWDVPVLIERIMRSHPDNDVRESAARTIAALDGRVVS